MSKSTMVMATLYRLKEGVTYKEGVWNDKGRFEEVHNKIVKRSFVEARNGHMNNENYIIDEEATEKFMIQREKNIILNAEQKKRDTMSTSDLVNAIVGSTGGAKKNVATLPDGDPDEKWTVPELKAYCKENDIKFHHKAKEAKLLELINAE